MGDDEQFLTPKSLASPEIQYSDSDGDIQGSEIMTEGRSATRPAKTRLCTVPAENDQSTTPAPDALRELTWKLLRNLQPEATPGNKTSSSSPKFDVG
ncbi:hypothetical protein GE061_008826 [Apolygus lucorum]|uniref:Uncharacterized protein n=1 Tax=Apolygus lucorum TaxID=248454 RepID=A0A8S9WPW6_APOLU|nr:hypothetical protein GE061_008826 [Apolygus lucorum]